MTKVNLFASIKGGVAIGTKRGHVVTKRKPALKNSATKGKKNKTSTAVKQIVREVCGFAPYEKRVLELLRTELDKRALRFAKKRLGSHQRGKNKREELSGVLRQQRAKAAKADK